MYLPFEQSDEPRKPCPFCGEDEVVVLDRDIASTYRVFCGGCAASGAPHLDRATAIKRWNERKQ